MKPNKKRVMKKLKTKTEMLRRNEVSPEAMVGKTCERS